MSANPMVPRGLSEPAAVSASTLASFALAIITAAAATTSLASVKTDNVNGVTREHTASSAVWAATGFKYRPQYLFIPTAIVVEVNIGGKASPFGITMKSSVQAVPTCDWGAAAGLVLNPKEPNVGVAVPGVEAVQQIPQKPLALLIQIS